LTYCNAHAPHHNTGHKGNTPENRVKAHVACPAFLEGDKARENVRGTIAKREEGDSSNCRGQP